MTTTDQTADPMKLARDALQKLACLGNGDKPGNSTGNVIALTALAAIDAIPTSVQAVAWHMRVIGCDGSADWLEMGAAHPETPRGVEALPLVYAQASVPSGEPAETGWLQDRGLLYRLTDERRPANRDEIRVTMADGSRSDDACTRRAGELLDRINATTQTAPAPAALLVRDLAASLGAEPLILCKLLAALGYEEFSVNMAVPANAAGAVEKHFTAAPAPAAVPAVRTLLEQYDREHLPGYREGYEDGRQHGYAVGHRHGLEQAASYAAAQASPAPAPTDDRAAFEAWALTYHQITNPGPLTRMDGGRYFYGPVNASWEAWKAARTQAPAVAAPEPLRAAAQAVLDRWNSPRWEWSKQGPTADLIQALADALAPNTQEPQQ